MSSEDRKLLAEMNQIRKRGPEFTPEEKAGVKVILGLIKSR